MTKKFNRKTKPIFDGGDFIPLHHIFKNHARLEVDESDGENIRVRIRNYWFNVRELENLIAELIYIKEDLANNPHNLEAQQHEDMEELGEEDLDWGDNDDEPEEEGLYQPPLGAYPQSLVRVFPMPGVVYRDVD